MSLITWTRTDEPIELTSVGGDGPRGQARTRHGRVGRVSAPRVRGRSTPRGRPSGCTTSAEAERARAAGGGGGGRPGVQADLTDEAHVDRLFETRARHSAASTSARRWRASGPRTTARLGRCRWSAGARRSTPNLTSSFLTARGFLREVERTARQPSAHRVDGGPVRRGRTCRLRGGEGRDLERPAALAEERGRPRGPGGRVNVVAAPGWTYSPMTRGALDPAAVDRATRTMALRKVATRRRHRAPGRRALVRRAVGPRDRRGRHRRGRHGGAAPPRGPIEGSGKSGC